MKYKLFDRNSLPCCRYNTEPVLESTNMILYYSRSFITEKAVDFNRTEAVLIDRENETALVIDIAVPSIHSLPKTEGEKITKYENLTLEIKNIWKLNNFSVYPLVISVEGVVTRTS